MVIVHFGETIRVLCVGYSRTSPQSYRILALFSTGEISERGAWNKINLR
jgi:hypothetical protein